MITFVFSPDDIIGYYCPEATAAPIRSTFKCPLGHYCPAATGDYKAFPCPAGTYNDRKVGAVAEAECNPCPAGYHCQAGTSDPYCDGCKCPRGHYCPQGSKTIEACPAGKFTEQEGTTGLEFCKSCPVGHYCASGGATPTPCPSGKFNQFLEQQADTACTDCTAGKACTSYGLGLPDADCAPGHYCPGGNLLPNQAANRCPAGTYTNYLNLTAVEQCQACPPRVACLIGTGGQQNPPVACAPGHYCPGQTAMPTQYKCPAGTYTNLTNLATPEECYPCTKGWYCLEGSVSPTGLCYQGHWCPEGQ